MRHKITLYIKGAAVDLDDASFILFNYTKDDLSDPAVVKNSFSQSISLPATEANCGVFSSFGRLDRVTGSGFNTSAREPFEIYAETGEIIHKGYCKVDGVTRKNGRISSYNVTLYGGLGSLLYYLSADDQGTAKTLAALTWSDDYGDDYGPDDTINVDHSTAWTELENNSTSDIYGIFNFCAMYNGFPEDFDANKALCRPGAYDNVPQRLYKDNAYYCGRNGVGSPYVVTFGDKMTEWGAKDLRSYLQRPVVKVVKLIEAISNYATAGGYRLVIDSSVTSIYHFVNLWMTLPMIQSKYWSNQELKIKRLLEGTISPADVLIAIVKAFNLFLVTDAQGTTLMSRNKFYFTHRDEILDLTERVDVSQEVSVSPVCAEAHFYDFAFPGIGADAVATKTNTGREAGSVRVDTAYPFNDDVKDVLEGTPLKYALSSNPQTTDNVAHFFTASGGSVDQEYIPASAFTTMKAKVYKISGSSVTDDSQEIEMPSVSGLYISAGGNMQDWMSRIQAQDKDRKASDGSYLLVKYDGFKESPELEYDDTYGDTTYLDPVSYSLTKWDQTRVSLNGGTDCWDMRRQADERTSLPDFFCLSPSSIFDFRWKNYINDLYSRDTCVLKCKVDLRGLVVGQELLGRFFWYAGSIWTINRIIDHSLTTDDLTECELVKVQDMEKYYNGQS